MKSARIALLVGMLATAGAVAQDAPEDRIGTLDLTMVLMPEGAMTPEAITRTIELPAAAEQARRSSAAEPESANAPPGDVTAPQLDAASAARERVRDLGRELGEQARENVGRGPPAWVAAPNRPDLNAEPSEPPPAPPPARPPPLPATPTQE